MLNASPRLAASKETYFRICQSSQQYASAIGKGEAFTALGRDFFDNYQSQRGLPSAGVLTDHAQYLEFNVALGDAMNKLFWVTLPVCLLAAVSAAQDTPQVELSAGYSGLYIVKGYTIWNNGGSASAAFNINDWLGVVGDFGGYLGHVPQDLVGETYVFGPRFSYRRAEKRIVPFAQALFGGSHFSQNTGGITGGGTQFTFAVGGGADLLSRSERFALRPQVDFFGIQSQGAITPSVRLSIGIVYRIGKK